MEPEKRQSGKGGPEGQLAVRTVFWRRSGSPRGPPEAQPPDQWSRGRRVGDTGAPGGGWRGARRGLQVWAQPPAPFLRLRRAPHTAILVSSCEARMRAAPGVPGWGIRGSSPSHHLGQAPPTVLLVQCRKALGCSEWAPYFFPCSALTCRVCFESISPPDTGARPVQLHRTQLVTQMVKNLPTMRET